MMPGIVFFEKEPRVDDGHWHVVGIRTVDFILWLITSLIEVICSCNLGIRELLIS